MSTPYIGTPADLQAIRNYQSSRSGVLNGLIACLTKILGGRAWSCYGDSKKYCYSGVDDGLQANLVQSKLSSVGLTHTSLSHKPSLD